MKRFLSNYDELREAVIVRLGRLVPAVFETWAAQQYHDSKLSGEVHLRDAIWFFLYFLCFYPSAHDMEAKFNLPHSFVWRLIRCFVAHLSNFTDQWIRMPDAVSRYRISILYNPPRLARCTLTVDGTDCRCWLCPKKGEKKEQFYSFKFRKSAMRTQVAVTQDQTIVWTSKSQGASIHDKRQLEESDFAQHLHPGESAMGDTGYVGCRFPMTTPFKRPPQQQLTAEQSAFNELLNASRGRIEHVFGKIKTTFAILNVPYRHSKKHFNTLFRVCCALYNVDRYLMSHPEMWEQIRFVNWNIYFNNGEEGGDIGGGPYVPPEEHNGLGFGQNNNYLAM